MPRRRAQPEMDWTPVVGRALAFLCLHYADMRKATLLEQADFLGRFGLPYAEAATILGTSEPSLKELARQRGQKKSTKKTAKKGAAGATRIRAKTTRGRRSRTAREA